MLDSVNQLGGTSVPRTKSVFAKYPLANLLRQRTDGYAWAKGVHLYSELRPVSGLEFAASDEIAKKYLRVIEAYAHAGIVAARLFGLDLLELQGNVLHFHKDGENVEEAAAAAVRFSYVFTKVLYEVFADVLDGEWNGFAICMDHGDSLIIQRGQSSNSSAISLGPSANRPAKRLLYGRTAAGHAEIPGRWVEKILGKASKEEWYALNLRDRGQLPNQSAMENAVLEADLRRALGEYQTRRMTLESRAQPFALLNASALVDQGNFSTERPLRMHAYCMRVDLDRFSKTVEEAFQRGEDAVENIAKGFIKILEFGDFFEKRHYGVVRLPWAGDCVSFLIPPKGDLAAFQGKEWVNFVEEWQTFAGSTDEGRQQRWSKTFTGVLWSVGMTYAKDGLCLVAPISTESRKFLIGVGAPLTLANDAQNLGKGGDTIIHSLDYEAAYPMVRTLFSKITNTSFWRGEEITERKIRDAAIKAGKSENASRIQIAEKAATVSIPQPRPYCP